VSGPGAQRCSRSTLCDTQGAEHSYILATLHTNAVEVPFCGPAHLTYLYHLDHIIWLWTWTAHVRSCFLREAIQRHMPLPMLQPLVGVSSANCITCLQPPAQRSSSAHKHQQRSPPNSPAAHNSSNVHGQGETEHIRSQLAGTCLSTFASTGTGPMLRCSAVLATPPPPSIL
jgi:hypothetical protein